MRLKGKKPIFNRNDTFSLYATINPVICAGLKKFKEVVTTDAVAKEWAGVPSPVLHKLFPEGGDVNKWTHSDGQIEAGLKEWYSILDKMIYAFEDNEPCISDYKFEFVSGEGDGEETEEGYFQWNKVPDNQDEYDRYRADEVTHAERVREGLALFGEYNKNLWW